MILDNVLIPLGKEPSATVSSIVYGRLYLKAARTGPYAFAEEVKRVNGRVVSTYLGIREVPDAVDVIESKEGEPHAADQPGESEQVQQKRFKYTPFSPSAFFNLSASWSLR